MDEQLFLYRKDQRIRMKIDTLRFFGSSISKNPNCTTITIKTRLFFIDKIFIFIFNANDFLKSEKFHPFFFQLVEPVPQISTRSSKKKNRVKQNKKLEKIYWREECRWVVIC